MREIVVFGGSAHPALTAEICALLGVPQQPVRLRRFANDCLEVHDGESVSALFNH